MTTATIQQAFERGLAHHQAGRLQEAERLYRSILEHQPDRPDVLNLLGVLKAECAEPRAAVELFDKAIALNPAHPAYHNNLGNTLRELKQFDRSISACRRALELKPDYAEAHSNLANALKENGQPLEAITEYRHAIRLQPNYPAAHYNLANLFRDRGRFDDALAGYRVALNLQPGYLNARNNLATVLKDTGQLDEAISEYGRILRQRPDFAEVHHNLSIALAKTQQLDAAVAAAAMATQLKPDYADAHSNLSVVLLRNAQFDEGVLALRRAIALNPNVSDRQSALLLSINFLPGEDANSILRQALDWARRFAHPLRKFCLPCTNDRSPDRTLKIGYVSSDFKNHVSDHFILPLLASHDRQHYEIVCYAQVDKPDSVTRQMQSLADLWRDTVPLTDEQMAEQIRQDKIDILVNLKLHTSGNRLLVFARKPAPIQVTWLGYPGTTGLDTIDYRFTDPYLDPPGAADLPYSETSYRLPETFWCYAPAADSPPVNALPALTNGYITFASLNIFCKINDMILASWAQIMNRLPSSRLLLRAPRSAPRQRTIEKLGVAPQRVEFLDELPRLEYLQQYHRIDIALDTLPYNGHTTSLDCFWMGVPVVTLVGNTVVGRAGLSELSNLGLTELIARTPEQYVQIVVDLAGDLDRLQTLRSTLRQKMQASPLMDARRFAQNIEAAYRDIWRRWCASDPKGTP